MGQKSAPFRATSMSYTQCCVTDYMKLRNMDGEIIILTVFINIAPVQNHTRQQKANYCRY